MKKIIFTIASLMMFAGTASASEYTVQDVGGSRISSTGIVYFATGVQPPLTCSTWGHYFKFDTTTATGKSWYSTLLAAQLAKRKITLWYNPSSTPGTDQTSGCTEATAASVVMLGVSR